MLGFDTCNHVAQVFAVLLKLLHQFADLIRGNYLGNDGDARCLGLRSRIGQLAQIAVCGGNHQRVHHLTHGVELDQHVLHVTLDADMIARLELLLGEHAEFGKDAP